MDAERDQRLIPMAGPGGGGTSEADPTTLVLARPTTLRRTSDPQSSFVALLEAGARLQLAGPHETRAIVGASGQRRQLLRLAVRRADGAEPGLAGWITEEQAPSVFTVETRHLVASTTAPAPVTTPTAPTPLPASAPTYAPAPAMALLQSTGEEADEFESLLAGSTSPVDVGKADESGAPELAVLPCLVAQPPTQPQPPHARATNVSFATPPVVPGPSPGRKRMPTAFPSRAATKQPGPPKLTRRPTSKGVRALTDVVKNYDSSEEEEEARQQLSLAGHNKPEEQAYRRSKLTCRPPRPGDTVRLLSHERDFVAAFHRFIGDARVGWSEAKHALRGFEGTVMAVFPLDEGRPGNKTVVMQFDDEYMAKKLRRLASVPTTLHRATLPPECYHSFPSLEQELEEAAEARLEEEGADVAVGILDLDAVDRPRTAFMRYFAERFQRGRAQQPLSLDTLLDEWDDQQSPAKLKPELIAAAKALGFNMVEDADGQRRIVWKFAESWDKRRRGSRAPTTSSAAAAAAAAAARQPPGSPVRTAASSRDDVALPGPWSSAKEKQQFFELNGSKAEALYYDEVGWDIMVKTGKVEDELTRSIRQSRSAIHEEWQQHFVAEQLPFITGDVVMSDSIVSGDIAKFLLKRKVAVALKAAVNDQSRPEHRRSSANSSCFSGRWFEKKVDQGVGEARRAFGALWRKELREEPAFTAYEVDDVYRWLEARPVKSSTDTDEKELYFAGSPVEVLSRAHGGAEANDFEIDLEMLLRKKFLHSAQRGKTRSAFQRFFQVRFESPEFTDLRKRLSLDEASNVTRPRYEAAELAILVAVEWLQLESGDWACGDKRYPARGWLVHYTSAGRLGHSPERAAAVLRRFDDEYRLAKKHALTGEQAAVVELDAVENHLDQEELADGGHRYMAVGSDEFGLAMRFWTLHTRPDITAPVIGEMERGQVVLVTHIARLGDLEDPSVSDGGEQCSAKTVWLRCGRSPSASERLTGPKRRPVGWTRATGRRHQVRINIKRSATFEQKKALVKALHTIPHFKSAFGGMDVKARFGRFHIYALRIIPCRANQIADHVVVSAEFLSRSTDANFLRHVRNWAAAAILRVENTLAVAANKFRLGIRKSSGTASSDANFITEFPLSKIVDLTNPQDQPESTSPLGVNILHMPVMPGQTLMLSEHQTRKRSVRDFIVPWEALRLKTQPQQTHKLSSKFVSKLKLLSTAAQRRSLAAHEGLFEDIQEWDPTMYRLSQTFSTPSTALARLFRCCAKQKMLLHERAHYQFVKATQDLALLRQKKSAEAQSAEALGHAQAYVSAAREAYARQIKRDLDADQKLFHWTVHLKETQVLIGNVLTCALDESGKLNSPQMSAAVSRCLLSSPNPIWTAFDLAEALRDQAEFPPNENCSDDVRKYNRSYAKTLQAIATSIAHALDIPKHKDKDIAAWLQPKLNFEPKIIGALNHVDKNQVELSHTSTSDASKHERDVATLQLYVGNIHAFSAGESSDSDHTQLCSELIKKFKHYGSVIDARVETDDDLPADQERSQNVFTNRSLDLTIDGQKPSGKIRKDTLWGVVTMGESEGAQKALRCVVDVNNRTLNVKMYRDCIVDKLADDDDHFKTFKHGKNVHEGVESVLQASSGKLEDRGRIDAGPLYLSICLGDINFNSVPWIMEYISMISAGALTLEEKYEPALPTGWSKGFVSRGTLEKVRVKYYRELVKQKVWPRPLFTWLFYLWCGFQVPQATFKSPTARYLFDIIMYFFFLFVFTWGVALDELDSMHMATRDLTGMALYTRIYCWLYLIGSFEKELRQLVRLGLQTYAAEFWNWVELLSPAAGLGGLVFMEYDSSEPKMAREMLSLALVMLWCRLLQLSRASETIGPLIPVILRMLAEVAKFGSVMAILIMGFSVAMFTILQPKSNEVFVEASGDGNSSSVAMNQVPTVDAEWPAQYSTLASTIKTMTLASIGEFEMDYTDAKHEMMAEALMAVFIVLMVLALLNLLITLLMRRYDEVSEEMAKQFAFVRASAVFWQQDSVLDDELPPPFNLVQMVHPEREKLAWLVWLLIWTPAQLVLFVALWCIATVLCGPWKLLFIIHKTITSGAEDTAVFSVEEELREKHYQTHMTVDDMHSHRSTVQHPKPTKAAKFLKTCRHIVKICYVPACAIGLWFGLFIVLAVVGILHWLVGLLASLYLVLVVYWPAVKSVWRALGARLIPVVRAEIEAEEAANRKVQQHLHRKNATIGQAFIDRRDARVRKSKNGKLWRDILGQIIEDAFTPDTEIDQVEEFKDVVVRVLDNSVPTFSSIIKITKIQRAYTKWRQYRRNAVQSGLPIMRHIDQNGDSRFTVENERGVAIAPSVGLMREFVRGAITDRRVGVQLSVRGPAGTTEKRHLSTQLDCLFDGAADGEDLSTSPPAWLEPDGSYMCDMQQ